MSANIIDDIVKEYQSQLKKGYYEVYYKRDLIEGVKLVIAIAGIGKIFLLLGGAASAALGSLVSFAVNNPQSAIKLGQVIARNGNNIKKIIIEMGSNFNDGYNSLNNNQKKALRTIILFIARNGLDWEDLK